MGLVFICGSFFSQEAETKARTLEEEIHKLEDKLEEKNGEIMASSEVGFCLLFFL